MGYGNIKPSSTTAKNPESGLIGPCGHRISYIIDSRTCNRGNGIRRRRVCHICKVRWTTFEGTANRSEKLKVSLQAAYAMLIAVNKMQKQIEEFIVIADDEIGVEAVEGEIPVGEGLASSGIGDDDSEHEENPNGKA